MVVKSKRDAWRIAGLIFPGDFKLDTAASLRAGYSIYSPCDLEELPFNNGDEKFKYFEPRICDLGIRLEVVLEDNTVNIWVDESTPPRQIETSRLQNVSNVTASKFLTGKLIRSAHLYFLPLVAIIPI